MNSLPLLSTMFSIIESLWRLNGGDSSSSIVLSNDKPPCSPENHRDYYFLLWHSHGDHHFMIASIHTTTIVYFASFQEAKKKSEPINVCGRESLKDAWQSSCSGTWSMHARQQTSGNKAFGCSQNESCHCNAQPWSWVGHWAESFRRVGLEQHPILYLRGHCYLLQVVKAAAPKFLRAECTVRSKAQRCRSW